jgi:hypothetical protein
MAGSFSNYAEQKLLDHIFGGPDYTRPGTVHFALFTAVSDGEAGLVTEVMGGGYSRKSITNNTTLWSATSSPAGSKHNLINIEFNTATAAWGTVTHVGIYDAATGGNLLAYGELDTPRVVNAGDTPRFNVGTLVLTLN